MFFSEVIEPVLSRELPRLRYAAGLFGAGSDVLGYDTARSMDHDWGPRCSIVLDAADERMVGDLLKTVIAAALPTRFRGFPVLFQDAPGEPGILIPADPDIETPLRHRVEVTTLESIGQAYGYVAGDEDEPSFWLTISDQRLLELTAGGVFRDDLGNLSRFRSSLAFYPDTIWRYRMAALWMRISQIEPFVGRTGEVDDETGSYVIGARLVEDIMRLALSQSRRYAPYSKWLGTAFSKLAMSSELLPHLDMVRRASGWSEREAGIVAATSKLVHAHNSLRVTEEIEPSPRPFHSRPFMVIGAERVSEALAATLRGTALGSLPNVIGGIDQFVDSTDALNSRWLRHAVREAIRENVDGRAGN